MLDIVSCPGRALCRPNGLGRSGSVGAVIICMEFRNDPDKSFLCKSVSNAYDIERIPVERLGSHGERGGSRREKK